MQMKIWDGWNPCWILSTNVLRNITFFIAVTRIGFFSEIQQNTNVLPVITTKTCFIFKPIYGKKRKRKNILIFHT